MAHIPQIEFYKTRQFGEKLNMSFVFLRENAGPFLKAQLLIAGPILLLLNILMSKYSLEMLNFNPMDPTANDFIAMANVYGLAFLSTIVTGSIMPAIAYGYMRTYQERPPLDITMSSVTNGLASRIFNIIGYNILVAIVVTIGLFFFILPGIYLFVVLSLGSSIIVFENSNPIDAFGRAFTLIRGKWWSTFGLIFVMVIITYIISMLFSLPRGIMVGFDAFTSIMDMNDPNKVLESMGELSPIQQVLSILFSALEAFGAIITYSLTYLALAFQYFNLIERRESRGLMADIEGWQNEDETSSDEETY